MSTKKQTAGRDALGAFAPKFAELNDDTLFGEIWTREKELSPRDRSLTTITALISGGNFEQLPYHLKKGKENGLTQNDIAEVITHLAFYIGWPKAWSAFNIAKEIYKDEAPRAAEAPKNEVPKISDFPVGGENTAYTKYFSGKSWLAPLSNNKDLNAPVSNVTFEPRCRNNWHSHTGGQILIAVGGIGYYQEKGKKSVRMMPGDVIEIAPNIVHWHGAAPDSWFSHLAIACNPQTNKNLWLEPVSDKEYAEATN